MTTFDSLRQPLTTVDNFWQLMTTFDNFWQLMTTFDNFWHREYPTLQSIMIKQLYTHMIIYIIVLFSKLYAAVYQQRLPYRPLGPIKISSPLALLSTAHTHSRGASSSFQTKAAYTLRASQNSESISKLSSAVRSSRRKKDAVKDKHDNKYKEVGQCRPNGSGSATTG